MLSVRKIKEGIFAVQVMVLWAYLCGNIAFGREHGVLIQLLLIFLLLGGIQILTELANLRIRFPILGLVLLFLSVAFLKYSFDLKDGGISAINYLVGTTGGMGLFYVIGLLASYRLRCHQFASPVLFIILLGFYFCSAVFLFSNTLKDLRPDLLLVRDSGFYQRPGDFAVLMHVIITMFYVSHGFAIRLRNKKKYFLGVIIISAVYVLSSLTIAITVQMIGSNKSFLILVLLTLLAAAYVVMCNGNKIVRLFNNRHPFWFCVKMLFSLLAYISLIGALVLLTICLLGQDWQNRFAQITSEIRIMNFGKGSVATSVSGRAEIAHQYLWQQLRYAPILGNANVSIFTSGEDGNYVHSSILSLWTILGLPGVFIFTTLIFMIFRAIYRRALCRFQVNSNTDLHSQAVHFFGLINVLVIFFLSLVGTHFSWAPLWFSIGFHYPCVYLKPAKPY